jgi:polysaccharide deacetylase 2 family uncharacterized protein YibQ
MAKKNGAGLLRVAYAIVLCLFGMLLWLMWQGRAHDYYRTSVDFDNAVVDLLVSKGIGNSCVVAQSRSEKAVGKDIWVENYKELLVPEGVDADDLVAKITRMAKAKELTLLSDVRDGNTRRIALGKDGRTLSHIVLLRTESRTKNAGKRFALIIDDVGYTGGYKEYLELGVPVTLAVLPRERFSSNAAKELSDRKIPFIIHFPMEPLSYPKDDPGKGALFVNLTDSEIRRRVLSGIDSVPGAAGLSNHMGSRFTGDEERMRVVAGVLKEKGLFLFDSYTSPKTKAREAARAEGLPFAASNLFLDLKTSRSS